jgi:PPE-repeat protein
VDFPVLPPEVNSARIHSGVGSAPMLAAAAAWDGLATELTAAASSFGSVTSGLAAGSWQGPAAAAMVAAAAPYTAWLTTAATHSESAAGHARTVAAAYEAAHAATVPPSVVAANRAQIVSLLLANVFGQNAPAIAATEAEYERIWAQDVTAMSSYLADAAAAGAHLKACPLSHRLPLGPGPALPPGSGTSPATPAGPPLSALPRYLGPGPAKLPQKSSS